MARMRKAPAERPQGSRSVESAALQDACVPAIAGHADFHPFKIRRSTYCRIPPFS